MSYQTALSNLAALPVAGVDHLYGIDTVPEMLTRAQLPALIVMPLESQSNSLFQDSGYAFEGLAFAGGVQTVRYLTTHLLLIAPQAQGAGLRQHLPQLVSAVDAYMAALGADPTLGDALDHPAQVRIEPGIYTFGGTAYVGCAFRHRWIIAL